jgi:hypothetical protein
MSTGHLSSCLLASCWPLLLLLLLLALLLLPAEDITTTSWYSSMTILQG